MKKATLSLAILALLGCSEAVDLARQHRVVSADDFDSTGEHDYEAGAKKLVVRKQVTRTVLNQHVSMSGDPESDGESDGDETMAEKEARENEINSAKKSAAVSII